MTAAAPKVGLECPLATLAAFALDGHEGREPGLNLDEIRLLLQASPADGEATDRLRDVAERKLPELAALIERAELVRSWLEDAARCLRPTFGDCPLFEPDRLPERLRT